MLTSNSFEQDCKSIREEVIRIEGAIDAANPKTFCDYATHMGHQMAACNNCINKDITSSFTTYL